MEQQPEDTRSKWRRWCAGSAIVALLGGGIQYVSPYFFKAIADQVVRLGSGQVERLLHSPQSNIPTGSIDRSDSQARARLKEARTEARCLEERERAKEQSLLRMNSTRSAHDLCLSNYMPNLKELFAGMTAKDKCAPHHDAFQDAEKQYKQAGERQCKRTR